MDDDDELERARASEEAHTARLIAEGSRKTLSGPRSLELTNLRLGSSLSQLAKFHGGQRGQELCELALTRGALSLALENAGQLLSANVFRLTHLTTLKISDSHMEEVPEGISSLAELILLDLSRNALFALSPEIALLPKLVTLQLGTNRLSQFQFGPGGFSRLKTLSLHENAFREFPQSLLGIATLSSLSLSANEIEVVPDAISGLHHLEALYLRNNKIKVIPRSLWMLPQLKLCYLAHNQISTLPSFSTPAPLEILELSCNSISSISEDIKLIFSTLKNLNLENNVLTHLPMVFDSYSGLVNVAHNPHLTAPPAFLFGGSPQSHSSVLRTYFLAIQKQGGSIIPRIKAVLVGDALAGKTSLVHSLSSMAPQTTNASDRTMSMDITRVFLAEPPKPGVPTKGTSSSHSTKDSKQNTLLVEFYDAGGQYEYRTTHPLFLDQGDRTLFLIVCSLEREPSLSHLSEWVNLILDKSPHCTIKLIASKVDLLGKKEKLLKQRRADYFKTFVEAVKVWRSKHAASLPSSGHSFFSRFPKNEDEILFVTATKKTSVLEFSESLYRWVMEDKILPAIDTLVPIPYCRLLNELDSLRGDFKYFIELSVFKEIVLEKALGFSSEHEMIEALTFLAGIGVLLYFPSNKKLSRFVFLRPQWVSTVVRVVVRHDLAEISQMDMAESLYHYGRIQCEQDLADLMSSGVLWHRLLPILVKLRLAQVEKQISSPPSSTSLLKFAALQQELEDLQFLLSPSTSGECISLDLMLELFRNLSLAFSPLRREPLCPQNDFSYVPSFLPVSASDEVKRAWLPFHITISSVTAPPQDSSKRVKLSDPSAVLVFSISCRTLPAQTLNGLLSSLGGLGELKAWRFGAVLDLIHITEESSHFPEAESFPQTFVFFRAIEVGFDDSTLVFILRNASSCAFDFPPKFLFEDAAKVLLMLGSISPSEVDTLSSPLYSCSMCLNSVTDSADLFNDNPTVSSTLVREIRNSRLEELEEEENREDRSSTCARFYCRTCSSSFQLPRL